jgi:hypothetical protein
MSERVDRAADGEWPHDELTDEERRQLEAVRRGATSLRSSLSAGMPHDLDERVMRRISELGLEPLPQPLGAGLSHAGRRIGSALWARREVRFTLRPLHALAVAASLALIPLVHGVATQDPPPDFAGDVVSDRTRVFVQFRLRAEGAFHVALAGSFTDWQPLHALHPNADGVWTLVLPLEPGVHDYSFVVDGQRWMPDPYGPHVDDGFGGVNSRITLVAAADPP